MGVNYDQKCILGWAFERDDVEKEIRQAEYEQQPRYDTKTGEVTHHESVLVKARDYVLELAGEKADCMWELSEAVAKKFDLQVDRDAETFYIGISLGDPFDMGRVELLNGTVCLDDLAMAITTLKELQEDVAGDADFRGHQKAAIALHFIARVG